jgi:hypothetical protein
LAILFLLQSSNYVQPLPPATVWMWTLLSFRQNNMPLHVELSKLNRVNLLCNRHMPHFLFRSESWTLYRQLKVRLTDPLPAHNTSGVNLWKYLPK